MNPIDRPITLAEKAKADTAICRHHKGLIRETGDVEGTVFYCPIGDEYWRYTRAQTGFNTLLPYQKSGVL